MHPIQKLLSSKLADEIIATKRTEQNDKVADVTQLIELLRNTDPSSVEAIVVMVAVNMNPGQEIKSAKTLDLNTVIGMSGSMAAADVMFQLLQFSVLESKISKGDECTCAACEARRALLNDPALAEAVEVLTKNTEVRTAFERH